MIGLGISSQLVAAESTFHVHPVHHAELRMVNGSHWSIYRKPFGSENQAVLSADRLKGRDVQVIKEASLGHRNYFLITYRGKKCGWIDSYGLTRPRKYVLPYRYCSQLYPLWAPEACEAASLKMALSTKGLANGIGLKYIIDRMPKSSNANHGFSGNPYRDNSGILYWLNLIKHGFNGIASQTIYPRPLAHYARRYDQNAKNITGASKHQLIQEIKHNHSVVFVGAFQMINTNDSYHILTLVGYQPGKFLVADPYRKWGQKHQVFWVSTHHLMRIFTNQLRHRRAVAV